MVWKYATHTTVRELGNGVFYQELIPFAYPGSTLPLAQTSVVDIVLTLVINNDTNAALTPGEIAIMMNSTSAEFSLHSPTYLMPGYHQFGLVEVTEWRNIKPSFSEALGHRRPVCTSIG